MTKKKKKKWEAPELNVKGQGSRVRTKGLNNYVNVILHFIFTFSPLFSLSLWDIECILMSEILPECTASTVNPEYTVSRRTYNMIKKIS